MDHPTRPWRRALYLPALVVVLALGAGASAWAAGSDPTDPQSPPAQYQPAQDDGSAQPDRERPDGRDCPEGGPGRGDGDGGSAQPDATATPDGGSAQPDATATPDV
jgi:hypothetical protein